MQSRHCIQGRVNVARRSPSRTVASCFEKQQQPLNSQRGVFCRRSSCGAERVPKLRTHLGRCRRYSTQSMYCSSTFYSYKCSRNDPVCASAVVVARWPLLMPVSGPLVRLPSRFPGSPNHLKGEKDRTKKEHSKEQHPRGQGGTKHHSFARYGCR
jgi:hypothetical protein